MIVIADTSPINYLVLIGSDHLLPAMFGRVVIPKGVLQELTHSAGPQRIQDWASNLPAWIELKAVHCSDPSLDRLGLGEREGLALAQEIGADLILLDDLSARQEAERRRIRVTGTLGILRDAAKRNLVNLPEALNSLRSTSFYAPPSLIADLLREDAQLKGNS
jgi:predicted nucleic acid-binding protein